MRLAKHFALLVLLVGASVPRSSLAAPLTTNRINFTCQDLEHYRLTKYASDCFANAAPASRAANQGFPNGWKQIGSGEAGSEAWVQLSSRRAYSSDGQIAVDGRLISRMENEQGVKTTSGTYIADCKYQTLHMTNAVFLNARGQDVQIKQTLENYQDTRTLGGTGMSAIVTLMQNQRDRSRIVPLPLTRGSLGDAFYQFACKGK